MHNSRDKPSKNTPVEKIVSIVLCITLIVLMLGLLGTLFKPKKDGSNKVSSNTNNSMEDNTTEDDFNGIIFYEAQLVTDVGTLADDDIIFIVSENDNYAMSYKGDSSFSHQSVFKADENTVAINADTDIILFHVGIVDESFTLSFYPDDYLCCSSLDTLKLGTQTNVDEYSSWHIDIVNGSANIMLSSNSSIGLKYSNGFGLHNFDTEALESSGVCIYKISSLILS